MNTNINIQNNQAQNQAQNQNINPDKKVKKKHIRFTPIAPDSKGNPRVTINLIELTTPYEQSLYNRDLNKLREIATSRIKALGGKLFKSNVVPLCAAFKDYKIKELEQTIHNSLTDTITYSREPTKAEIKFGYGATHYADLLKIDCLKGDGTLKKWVVSHYDNLRYNRY